MQIRETSVPGYERVVWGVDKIVGYQGIAVIHSTVLGPAVGGTRYWHYANEDEALTDALRLARGMTYKNALVGLPCGGGKSIVLRNDALRNNIVPDGAAPDREKLFRAHGQLVETLAGKYITAEDVGTSPSDMEYIAKETQHVAGLQGGSGDPSPKTARGVFRAMQAAAKHQWGSDALSDKTVAIQGCGHVGYHLAGELHRAGARLIVTDVDQERIQRVVNDFGADVTGLDTIYTVTADIFAPCALGGVLNDQTIPQLKVKIVAGAANNQLLEPRHGQELRRQGVLYAPDYAANAGGVINGCCREMLGWDQARTSQKIDDIYATLLNIFRLAAEDNTSTSQAADRLAEAQLARSVTPAT